MSNEASSLQQQSPEDDSNSAVALGDAVSTEVPVDAAEVTDSTEGQPLNPSQSEMPFAVVQGKELNIMPKDLYIPPEDLEVFLEAFEGRWDLLV